jgi:hypothetical protein
MSPPAPGLVMREEINGSQSQEQPQAEDQANQEVAKEVPMNRHLIIIRWPKVKKTKKK